MATSMAYKAASMRTRTSLPYSLLNSQSVGHDLQETPGHLTIIEQLDHVFSARFAHPLPQTVVLHECQEVPGDVGHAGPVLGGPRVWKHDTMAIVDPVAFSEHRLADLPLLRYFRQECRFAVHHRVEKCHRVGRYHRPCAGVSLHLNHSETLQPRWCGVDIAGGQQVGHEIVRDHVGGVGDLLADAQIGRQLEVDQVLLDRARLRPNFADISPVGRLGINQRQRLHDLLGALGPRVAADGQDHDLAIRHSQGLADRSDLQVVAAVRREAVRVATHRQHLDIVPPDAIPDVCLLHPVRGDQDQRQSVQHLEVCCDITVGHEPWYALHPKLLRVEDQVRNMAPEPYADHQVRLEPAVVPFLFLGRFEMYRVDIHADLAQAPAK